VNVTLIVHVLLNAKLVPQVVADIAKSPVSVEKPRFTARFLALLASWLIAFLVSPDQVHAVAICGVGLQLRNRTSRFRFCAVAAR
jgi:hypothetical protein